MLIKLLFITFILFNTNAITGMTSQGNKNTHHSKSSCLGNNYKLILCKNFIMKANHLNIMNDFKKPTKEYLIFIESLPFSEFNSSFPILAYCRL